MNYINQLFLRLALLPIGIYKRLGVDTVQLKTIVSTKLLMDDRRPNTFHQTQHNRKQTPITMSTVGTMLLCALFGLIYLMAFTFGNNIITQFTLYYSFFFFMLASTLITDFTSVLIDVRDNFIILPKPVSDRTFITARLLHIFVHICKLVVPMALPGIVYIGLNYYVTGVLYYVLMLLMLTLFTIFFINALYLLILKVTTPEKFKSIISYIQIFFAIAVYASYQVVPRLIGRYVGSDINLSGKGYSLAIPSFWFASGWKVLQSFRATPIEAVGTVLSIAVPLLSLYIVIKYLAPSFNQKLALLNSSDAEVPRKINTNKKSKQDNSFATLASKVVTQKGAERMGFIFTWKMTSRSRDFKLKVYPTIGYILVYVVLIFLNKKSINLQDIQSQNISGKILVISALYFSSLLLVMAISQITISEKYKAAWIYYACPIPKPGEVISGAIKAAVLKFYIPIVVVLTLAGIILIGPKLLPNIVLGLFNELLIASIIAYVHNRQLPFSQQQNNNSGSGNFIRSIFIMFCCGLIGLIHYAVYELTAVVIILSVLSMIATWLVIGGIKNTSWQALAVATNE